MAQPGGPFLSNARVCVVGAGALGCAVLPRLARMRIAELTIIDGDRVEQGNLERQPLFDEMDIGRFKASTAALWMRQILATGRALAHDVFLDANSAHDLLKGHDVVVEGVDDIHAKALIDRVCGELKIPLFSGGVHAGQGQVIVLHAPGANAGLTRGDLFRGRPGTEQDGCDMRDVPLELLEETGRHLATRVHDLLEQRPLVNGRIELRDTAQKRWMIIDPA